MNNYPYLCIDQLIMQANEENSNESILSDGYDGLGRQL